MLVDNIPSDDIKKQDKINYNCSNISYICATDDRNQAQFTIEKCGELNQKLSGNDYEMIYTSDLARQRAEYETWKSSLYTDALSIETILIPFLDVNKKVRYQSIRTGKIHEYMINKFSFSLKDCKTNIEMRRYYPSYPHINLTKEG